MKVSTHTASRIDAQLAVARVSRVRDGQASRVYLRGMSINTTTGKASHVYSISLIV